MSKHNFICLIILIFGATCFSFGQSKKLQKAPLFKNMSAPQYDGVVVWCKEFNVLSSSRVETVPAEIIKRMEGPKNLKKVNGPLSLQYKDHCIRVGLEKSCQETCLLFWHDANRDGLLNPMRELTSHHRNPKGRCKVFVEEVSCK